jgi:hypothetical protein
METTAQSPDVKKILGGKGKKLHTREMNIRRTENKGYIARHVMGDKNGNPPMDGQRGEAEYSHANLAELLKHVQDHMGEPEQEPDADDQEA